MTYELVFEKYISEPEYEFDDCRRVECVYVRDKEVSKELQENLGLSMDDLSDDLRLLFALAKGMSLQPKGYHFCCFGKFKEE